MFVHAARAGVTSVVALPTPVPRVLEVDSQPSLHLVAWGTLNSGAAARPVTGYHIEVGLF